MTYLLQVTDLHRHFIDHITIPSKDGKGVLRRVDDVRPFNKGIQLYNLCYLWVFLFVRYKNFLQKLFIVCHGIIFDMQ